MFATRRRTWVALGDPVGPPAEWPELVWSFIELADRHGGKVAFYQIPPSSLPLYLDAGLEVFKLGEMARVFLPSFSLEGSTRADLRYALKRGERDGLRFEMIPRERVASVIDEIEGISDEWLVKCAGEREKHFSVAAFHRDYVLSQPIALLRQNGEAVAFATVMMTDLREEVTVGLMRHKPGAASRYAMEYLFVRLIQCFRDQGYRSLWPRYGAAFWLACASPGAALASRSSCHLVTRTPFLQFSRPAHFQRKIRSGLGTPLSCRFGMVRSLSCPHRHCLADRRGHAGRHQPPCR